MIREIEINEALTLDDYAQHALLAPPVAELRAQARLACNRLAGRTVWMINSTAQGGGVAEMLPKQVSLLRQLGVATRWVVIETDQAPFFELTKRLHNLIHGAGQPGLGPKERELYDSVSTPLAKQLEELVKPGDVVIAHDPQPAGVAALLKRAVPSSSVVWRCHIGLEWETAATASAWAFLEPYLRGLDHFVFSATAYIPHFLTKNVSIIRPAIDPLTHKNRELHPVKLAGVLANAGLLTPSQPVLTPQFSDLVARLTGDGSFEKLNGAQDIGVMFRPTVTQVSRWDRLKGWDPLMRGFLRMKEKAKAGEYTLTPRSLRRLEIVRLVLAGPEPEAVRDDPEAQEVLEELKTAYQALHQDLQRDIAILSLPMRSTKENALIVNALQRCSSVIAQNSIQEGFGLVVTEAMWKRTPVLGSTAHGIRQQIRNEIDGILVEVPESPESVELGLLGILEDPHTRANWARSAQRRVYDEFLIFRQLARWLNLWVEITGTASTRPAPIS